MYEMSENIIGTLFRKNKLLVNDRQLPSIMVKIPKFKISDVIAGGADVTHPAFIVNGQDISELYIGKYGSFIAEERALSLPNEPPDARIGFTAAISTCFDSGIGWHSLTLAERAGIALFCRSINHLPKGNNDRGKDITEEEQVAVIVPGTNGAVETGSGPIEWSHDKTADGIWDLNGNLAEWVAGFRTVKGELQFMENNNAADAEHSQGTTSAHWKALDASTGRLVTPNGSGTTLGTVKVDFVDAKAVYGTSVSNTFAGYTKFSEITCDGSVSEAAQAFLKTYALLPISGDYGEEAIYYDNISTEAVFTCGGNLSSGEKAGVYALNGGYERNVSYDGVGIRIAYADFSSLG